MPAIRLQKIIAAAGIASRRKAEEMIVGGQVTVNGQIITELGTKADPERDHIRVAGKLLHGAERFVYLLMNKPRGYVTTVFDPENRPTVMHLLRGVNARVYPVGRLDYTSEGLLLMTNDGALAYKLTHPSSHVPRTYLVKVSGKPSAEALGKLRSGIEIGGTSAPGSPPRTTTSPTRIQLTRDAPNPWYEVTLFEGRNRQIRRMFEEVGHHVEKIKRVKLGPLELDVPPGSFRMLSPREVEMLRRAAAGDLRGSRPFRQGIEAKSRPSVPTPIGIPSTGSRPTFAKSRFGKSRPAEGGRANRQGGRDARAASEFRSSARARTPVPTRSGKGPGGSSRDRFAKARPASGGRATRVGGRPTRRFRRGKKEAAR
jgi:23S rRNA pseudouridine2605 synthase